MKMLIVLAGLVPAIALANGLATRKATVLESELNQLAQAAMQKADERAERNRPYDGLDRVSDSANQLARSIHREIYRSLLTGERAWKVRRALRTLMHNEFDRLDRQVANLHGRVWDIQRAWKQVQRAAHDLEDALDKGGPGPGGPVSAVCSGKSGGNFFKPKSHVECTVTGRGAQGYEVIFTNNGRQATTSGALKGRERKQDLVSNKVEIGWNPTYQVYVLTRNGNKKLVASGQCSGSPF